MKNICFCLALSILGISNAVAGDISKTACEQFKNQLNSENIPSKAALEKAMSYYNVFSKEQFQCSFPDVKVSYEPVGELENMAQWENFNNISLMSRTRFVWGNFEAITATLNGSKGHDNITVEKIGNSNQFMVVSFRELDKTN